MDAILSFFNSLDALREFLDRAPDEEGRGGCDDGGKVLGGGFFFFGDGIGLIPSGSSTSLVGFMEADFLVRFEPIDRSVAESKESRRIRFVPLVVFASFFLFLLVEEVAAPEDSCKQYCGDGEGCSKVCEKKSSMPIAEGRLLKTPDFPALGCCPYANDERF
jgi:hypothetical protein